MIKTDSLGWKLIGFWRCFGKQRKSVIVRYIDFVRHGIGLPSVWENLKNQMFLGSEDFVSHVRDKLNGMEKDELAEVPRLQRRAMLKPLDWYVENMEDSRTAGAPICCQRPSRFWELGCPKIYHEVEDTLCILSSRKEKMVIGIYGK
jgi:hypothetical protein